ncbi:MAG TPA: DinB family protein [Pyrinomonadaceae bacterium]|nr:DinB family protein [Pyrinomonadaceae bacterium]
MNLATITDLYRHMQWSDALVWRVTFACASAREDARVNELFYHLHLVQHAYLRGFRHEPMQAAWPTFADAPSLMLWGRSYYPEIQHYLESLSEEALANPFETPWVEIVTRELGRPPAEVTLGELMMQAPLHSLYHRGQINTRLREVGAEPPNVDYIVWCWLGKPSPEWIEIGAEL